MQPKQSWCSCRSPHRGTTFRQVLVHHLHDLLPLPAEHSPPPEFLPELGDDHQLAPGDQHLLHQTGAVGLGQGGEGGGKVSPIILDSPGTAID